MKKTSPAKKPKNPSQLVYEGSILELTAVPEDVRPKLIAVLDELRKLSNEKGKPENFIDEGLSDWKCKITKRTTGTSNGAVDISYFSEAFGIKCRSKNDLLKKLGLVHVETPSSQQLMLNGEISNTESVSPSSLLDDNFQLKQPLRISRFTVVTKLGRVDESSTANGSKIYPIGFTSRSLFPSPISPTKDVVYECTIEPGPSFVVRHAGAPLPSDIYDPQPEPTDRKKRETNGSFVKKEKVDDDDFESEYDEEETGPKKGSQKPLNIKGRIQPESISDRMLVFNAEGLSPHDAWMKLVSKLEIRVGLAIARFGYMAAAQPQPHVEESVSMMMREVVATVEAQSSHLRKPTILTSEELRTHLGEFLFGLNDYRIISCLTALPGVDDYFKKQRRFPNEATSKKLTMDLEKKLTKSVANFAERFRSQESRMERACDRRMRIEFTASKTFQDKIKKQVTKQASVTRKGEQALDQSKRTAALMTIRKLEEDVLSKLKGHEKVLEDFSSCIKVTKEFWDYGRMNGPLLTPEPSFNLPLEADWKKIDVDVLEAWDFCSNFAVVLGICSSESRAAYLPGESRMEEKLHLKTRAPVFRPSVDFEEFFAAFENCDEKLMTPVHTGLLRLATSTVYFYREEIRLRMETAKKNGHPFQEPGDEMDKFGKIVDVAREVKDGDFVHFLISGVPVCEATWFELARACFIWRKTNHKKFQDEHINASELEYIKSDMNKTLKIASSIEEGIILEYVEDGELDEDDEKHMKKSGEKPGWIKILSQIRDMPINRARRMQDLIQRAMVKIPKKDREAKKILKEALDLYESNAGGKMREKALEAIKRYHEGLGNGDTDLDTTAIDDEDKEEEKDEEKFNISIRPMTPFDSTCLKIALQNLIKKLASNSHFEAPLKEIENKISNGAYSGSPNVLADIDSVWQKARINRSVKDQIHKESITLEADFKASLDQACKDSGTLDLGGVADFCVVRRCGMTRPHEYFSLFPKTEREIELMKTAHVPLNWETLAEKPKPSENVPNEMLSDLDSDEEWLNDLYSARFYSDLKRSSRAKLLRSLVEIAMCSEEIKLEIKSREVEVEKARSKFGNANHLYSIAGSITIPTCEVEQILDTFLEQHQGTLDPCGVPLESIEHVKRDIHEENISRKRLVRTHLHRAELDRLLSTYDVRPKFLGYDRLDRAFFHFSSYCSSIFVFAKQDTCFRIDTGFELLLQFLEQSNDAREVNLCYNLKEVLPNLKPTGPGVSIWCKIAEQEDFGLSPNALIRSTSGGSSPSKKDSTSWTDFGPHVGLRVGRKFPFDESEKDGLSYQVGGFILAHLPAEGEDPPLWKMIHDDGDAEDLEANEVDESLQYACSPVCAQCGYYYPFVTETFGVKKATMKYAKTLANHCFSVATYDSKRLLDMKMILLSCERALAYEWSERNDWQKLVFAAKTWKGLRLCLALFEWKCLVSTSLIIRGSTFYDLFKPNAAAFTTNPSMLACRLLSLDRALKYPMAGQLNAAKKEQEDKEKKKLAEEKKAREEEKKLARQAEKRRETEERKRKREENARILEEQRMLKKLEKAHIAQKKSRISEESQAIEVDIDGEEQPGGDFDEDFEPSQKKKKPAPKKAPVAPKKKASPLSKKSIPSAITNKRSSSSKASSSEKLSKKLKKTSSKTSNDSFIVSDDESSEEEEEEEEELNNDNRPQYEEEEELSPVKPVRRSARNRSSN